MVVAKFCKKLGKQSSLVCESTSIKTLEGLLSLR